jgi:hypothetical protein
METMPEIYPLNWAAPQLLRKGEQTLKEVRQRYQAMPNRAAEKLGLSPETC